MSLPTQASAQYYYSSGNSVGYYGGTSYSDSQNYYQTPQYQNNYPTYYYQASNNAPAVVQNSTPAPTPTIYSNSANPNAVSTTYTPKAVTNTNTASTTANTTTATSTSSYLAANALFALNGFMPSGIIGWIFLAILILIIVILTRKVFGVEQKYLSTPLKHD